MHTYTIPVEEVVKYAIILTRVSGIMLLAPFFGSFNVPVPVKIALTFAISLLLYPSVPLKLPIQSLDITQVTFLLIGEVSIGVLIGLLGRFLFAAFEMFGQFVSFQVGFSLINTIDPNTAVQSTVLSVLELLVGLMVFMGLNGHHLIIKSIAESFSTLNPLKAHLNGHIIELLIKSSSALFLNGVQLAAPVTLVLIITDIVFGIISRVGSQIQILIIGLPLKSWLGFFCLSISFYFFPGFLEQHLFQLQKEIDALIKFLAL